MAFSPDGKTLAAASGDMNAKLWDAPSCQRLQGLEGHAGGAHSVAFSPDGTTLARGSVD